MCEGSFRPEYVDLPVRTWAWVILKMKIDRLLEMTMLLLNRRTVTARELADRFQVSTRTIYRTHGCRFSAVDWAVRRLSQD